MPHPSKLGHFTVLGPIGQGGLSYVYRALDTRLNREVAIKLLRPDLAHNRDFVTDFLREARNAAVITHPHIVSVYDVGEDNGQNYIVMELMQGRTLRDIIEKDGPLNEERALDIAIDVAQALRAAYRSQMIHGDIKPANIFVTEEAGAKVLDFGLAKLANVEVSANDEVWGSPFYVSPERAGRKAEDFRSDVYSLGASIFHALAGRPPFDADKPIDLAMKRLTEKPPLLRELNADVSERTEQAINKMLNKNAVMRYLDYDAVLRDLEDAKTEAIARRLGMTVRAAAEAKQQKKIPMPLLLGAIGAILVVVGALTLAFLRGLSDDGLPRQPQPSARHAVGRPPRGESDLKPVEFGLSAPDAQAVYVAGDFNNWDVTATPMLRRSAGQWIITLRLKPGRYSYKFVVDGKWTPDPNNPERVDDNSGAYNSVKVVPP